MGHLRYQSPQTTVSLIESTKYEDFFRNANLYTYTGLDKLDFLSVQLQMFSYL